jgi:hypothetical protein
MRLAKSILCGAAAPGLAAGSAWAGDAPDCAPSYSAYTNEPPLVHEETWMLLEPSVDRQVAW